MKSSSEAQQHCDQIMQRSTLAIEVLVMKTFAATAAIALALVSGAAFAERGSAELNTIGQPSSTASQQVESRQASVNQVVARNGHASPSQVAQAASHGHTDRTASHDQLVARNGATGEQTQSAFHHDRG
ncbi:hypothetical protein ACGK9R_02700 [Halomonas sp. HNIBRBA4712]|uniref:hypothetical protein n=1 Tax=Halomonas sp. HNIBRBA4712 TaxID=3373087 RepID=UPI00374775D8